MSRDLPITAETKREAFARLRPICRERLAESYPHATDRHIEGMIPTLQELLYADERQAAYREAKRVSLVVTERVTVRGCEGVLA